LRLALRFPQAPAIILQSSPHHHPLQLVNLEAHYPFYLQSLKPDPVFFKPHKRGEEEHGERSQFQHLSETREFPDKAFRVPERGRSLVALDDVIAGAINQYAQRTGANEF
jgi:hypothetical protein